jgi:hypothetical protein
MFRFVCIAALVAVANAGAPIGYAAGPAYAAAPAYAQAVRAVSSCILVKFLNRKVTVIVINWIINLFLCCCV